MPVFESPHPCRPTRKASEATSQALDVSPEGGQPHVLAALELGEIRLGYSAPYSEVYLSETKLSAKSSDPGILRRELVNVVDGDFAPGIVPVAR